MRNLLLGISLLGVLALAPVTIPKAVERPLRSIVALQARNAIGEYSNCTGFVINAVIGEVLTAAHCVEKILILTVDGRPSKVLRSDEQFAVVTIEPMTKPALTLSPDKPRIGDRVAVTGFAWGDLLIHLGRGIAGYSKDDLVFDGPLIQGMSGGPVTNASGDVVGLVQASNEYISIACSAEEIRKFLK